MNRNLVKKAVEEAEKDLKDKQVKEVKKIVLETLEKINTLKDERKTAQEKVRDIDKKIKILKMDIDDLKEGRLDRISERQEKDKEARDTSVVIIIKEKEVIREYPYWQWPYRIVWEKPYYPQCPSVWRTIEDGNTSSDISGNVYYSQLSNTNSVSINSSVAKWATCGSYEVGDDIINLR